MTWRTINWLLWGCLVVIVLLGKLHVIGPRFAWMALLVAGLAELVSAMRPASKRTTHEAPVELSYDMIRTQDRTYERAVGRLRRGGRVRYEAIEVQILGDTVICGTQPQHPLKQDERLARRELERARMQFEALCRASAEIDALRRGKLLRLVLFDAKKTKFRTLCMLENGKFYWASSDLPAKTKRDASF